MQSHRIKMLWMSTHCVFHDSWGSEDSKQEKNC